MAVKAYDEKSIQSLDWREHIRLRPGMYIGRLGDGSSGDDGIYVLLKEVVDNSIDEYVMGNGKKIEIHLGDDKSMCIRDFGRGIPLGKVKDCVSKINTGAKYDSNVFQKSVGLNGVGLKAVNALSERFRIESYRDGMSRVVSFERGILVKEDKRSKKSKEPNGIRIEFLPDTEIFRNNVAGESEGWAWQTDFIEELLWQYVFLNTGLSIFFNNSEFFSKNGLLDLLKKNIISEPAYEIIHLKKDNLEIAFTHGSHYNDEYFSYVNGQHTVQGGVHQNALREALIKTFRDFYKTEFDSADIRNSLSGAISIKIQEPIFESQTKTKLGSNHVEPKGETIRNFVGAFVHEKLTLHLLKNKDLADKILSIIQQNERDRKELFSIKKLSRASAKKNKLHNKKLRDCKIHYTSKKKIRDESSIFITEGDSASGSITKSRDVETQAVFSLRGKPLNCFGLSRKIVYENEEFNLMQAALDIEDGIENLRYNKIIIATDADVDGFHIRLLLMTFFLQFFPNLVQKGHVYILKTPLFRVRNKKKTYYCYSIKERNTASKKIGKGVEITRFKGLGEISPSEFKQFIGKGIKLERIKLSSMKIIKDLLSYFMGKNTRERQNFIIENLRVENDLD